MTPAYSRIARTVLALTASALVALPSSSGGLGVVSCARRAAVDAGQVATARAEPTRDPNAHEVPASAWSVALPGAPTVGADRPIDRCAGHALPPRPPQKYAVCDAHRATSRERISILHVADMHAHWQPTSRGADERSSLSVLRAHVDRRRSETHGRALFLDAGDDLEKGALADFTSEGAATVHLLDRLGLDARTLGNHDFAYGLDSVLTQAATKSFDVLASNLDVLSSPTLELLEFKAKRSVVYQVGCVRVGVFGLLIDSYDERDERSDAPYLGEFDQRHDRGDHDRYVDTARALVRSLRDDQHADVVIALDHIGAALDRALIDEVKGLDLVVSGHDHKAIYGYAQGRYGIMVNAGSFIGAPRDERVGEVVLDVDAMAHTASLVATSATRLGDLPDFDPAMETEVRRVVACFSPHATERLTDLTSPMQAARPDSWTPILDASIAQHFGPVDAILYEAHPYGGPLKGELLAGPVTPQRLLDLAYVEKQRAGGPGFTALVGVDVNADVLRAICDATLREPPGYPMHRVCPSRASIDRAAEAHRAMRVVIERRPLYAPERIFWTVPRGFPDASAIATAPVEVHALLLERAHVRGESCLALDRDAKVPCATTHDPTTHPAM